MAISSKKKKITQTDWEDKLYKEYPDIDIPGYWDTIASNCINWANTLSAGTFWKSIKVKAKTWEVEYKHQKDDSLFSDGSIKNFVSKSQNSIREKLFREWQTNNQSLSNVFNETGPRIPNINDLVRTRISCLYIDGVEYFADKIYDEVLIRDPNAIREHKGSIEGYFAQHIYYIEDVIFEWGGKRNQTKITCEIQVSSELSTRLWKSSHLTYEKHRSVKKSTKEWQWNPDDIRFLTHQLGHMLHLADGLLVQIRDKSINKENK